MIAFDNLPGFAARLPLHEEFHNAFRIRPAINQVTNVNNAVRPPPSVHFDLRVNILKLVEMTVNIADCIIESGHDKFTFPRLGNARQL